MKILIDGHMVGSRETGNERYTRNLFEGLLDLESRHFTPYMLVNRPMRGLRNLIVNDMGDAGRLIYGINGIVKKKNIDIVHSNYIGPLFKAARQVVTLHDLSFRRFPELYGLKDWFLFNKLLPRSLNLADAVIVPSEFTRKETLRYFPGIASKVRVTPEAADEAFHGIDAREAKSGSFSRWGLGSFVLAINSPNRKKNMERTISAFQMARKKGIGVSLAVVGGSQGVGIDRKSDPSVKFLGYVSDEELNMLYNACEVFIYYSVYEGFGLPILEASACGAAVIASDIPVHRELDQAVTTYADPENYADLAEKIIKVLGKPGPRRKKKKHLGFSWKKTALKTLNIYREVAEK